MLLLETLGLAKALGFSDMTESSGPCSLVLACEVSPLCVVLNRGKPGGLIVFICEGDWGGRRVDIQQMFQSFAVLWWHWRSNLRAWRLTGKAMQHH